MTGSQGTQIDRLVVTVETESKTTGRSVEKLAASLAKLGASSAAVQQCAKSLIRLSAALDKFDAGKISGITRMANALARLSGVSGGVRQLSRTDLSRTVKTTQAVGDAAEQAAQKAEKLDAAYAGAAERAKAALDDPDGPGPEVSRKLEGLFQQNPLDDATPDIKGDTLYEVIEEEFQRAVEAAKPAIQTLKKAKEAAVEAAKPAIQTLKKAKEAAVEAAEPAIQTLKKVKEEAVVPADTTERVESVQVDTAAAAGAGGGSSFSRTQAALGRLETTLTGLSQRFQVILHPIRSASDALWSGMINGVNAALHPLQTARSLLGGIASALNRFKSVAGTAWNGVSALFGGFLHPLRTARSLLGQLTGLIRGTGTAAREASGGFSLFGNGIVRSFGRIMLYRGIRSVLSGITNGISTGITNLYHANSVFAASMDRCATSAQYLKNSLAAALSPAINALAPVIDYVVDRVVDFINAVNQLIAVMTGASTWTRAVKVPAQWAEAADGAAGSAGAANDAAQELQRTLMGFDEINKLNAAPSGGGSGSGGAGGSGAGYSSMFTTQQVALDGLTGKLGDIWQVFQDAWERKGSAVLAAASNALGNLKTLAADVGTSFYNVWTDGTGQRYLESILDRVRSVLDLVGALAGTFDEAWNHAGQGEAMIASIFERLTSVNNLIASIRDSFTTMWNNGTGVSVWTNILQIITNVNDTLGNLADRFREAWNDNGTGQRIWQAIANAVNDVLDAINAATRATADWAGNLDLGPLVDAFARLAEAIEPLVDTISGVCATLYEEALLPIAKWAAESGLPVLINGIAAAVDWVNKLIQVVVALVDWLGQIKWNGLEGLKNGEGLVTLPNAEDLKLKVTGILTGVEDQVPEKNKKLDDVTGKISGMVDEIPSRNKIIEDAGINVTNMSDRISSGYKLVHGITAVFAKTSTNSLTAGQKTINTKANFTSCSNALTTSQKTVNTKANFTSRSNALSTAQRTFTAKANFTSRSDSLSTAAKTFGITAKATSLNTSSLKKNGAITLSVKLKATSLINSAGKVLGFATGGIYKAGRWQRIQGYAGGGSPQSARLFYANENGMPELVGRIGSSTAVMNNGQIVASVANGVYQATSLAFGRLGGYFQSIAVYLGQIPEAFSSAVNDMAGELVPPSPPSTAQDTAFNGEKLISKLASAMARAGDSGPTVIENHVYLDGKQIYQGTYEDIRRYSSSHNGKLPFPV